MISWVAMDRIVERKRAADAAYRRPAAGKVLRSDAKQLTDGELLAKLSSFGIELDRPSLERLCDQALSAEEIAQPLLIQSHVDPDIRDVRKFGRQRSERVVGFRQLTRGSNR